MIAHPLSWMAFAVVVACKPGGSDSAIEITGYLDAAKISATTRDAPGADRPTDVFVVGVPGAATDLASVTLTNDASGVSDTVDVAADGAFVAMVPALLGDALALDDEAAEPLDLGVSVLPPFPAHDPITVSAPEAGLVTVEVAFSDAQPADLQVWVADLATGDAAVLDTHSDHVRTGTIHAQAGHELLVHAHADASSTQAVGTHVP